MSRFDRMEKRFIKYLENLYHNVPESMYVVLIGTLVLGVVLAYSFKGLKQGNKIILWLVTTEYVFLLFYKTVILRSYTETTGHNFMPFWSYGAIQNGRLSLFPVIAMNVVAFIPVGFLIGCVSRMRWNKVLFIGLCISMTIESLQYFLKRGFAEFDDILHNVLGCMLGYGLIRLLQELYGMIIKRNVAVL